MDCTAKDLAAKAEITDKDRFQKDVIEGLTSEPKSLPSKYFYDKVGDGLFQDIMAMPEYYLTQSELEIFSNKTSEIIDKIVSDRGSFDLIELGAGDAMKSTYLLEELVKRGTDFTYMPIDISGNILSILEKELNLKLPSLKIDILEGEYFEMLEKATSISTRRKVVLFLGGNIGNMDLEDAKKFCQYLKDKLSPNDIVLIGFDLKKNPQIILDAYNDKTGITAAFNLNLLARINKELQADFDTNYFEHYQTYNPITGSCSSFLVSLRNQNILIGSHEIYFEKDEVISVEISQKFSREQIYQLALESGFEIIGNVEDSKGWFIDSIWKIK